MQTTYLDVQKLKKSYGDRLLFADVNFSVAEQQHVGLIAKNGTGKSTLLNILCGKETPDEGEVIFRNGIHVGYLEQTPHFDLEETVLDACIQHIDTTENLNIEAESMLHAFGIVDPQQAIGTLSGGQVKRVALAHVLLQKPDLLILDEPTNHLDLNMIEWLENYLMRYAKAFLMVTHDRYFLNRICDTILELDNLQMYTYRGNYEMYLTKRQERIEGEEAGMAKMKNLYRHELEWMRRMPKARGGKAKYRKDAFQELEARVKSQQNSDSIRIQNNSTYIGSKIFEAQYVSKSFPAREENGNEKIILKDFYYNFSRYEKLGIIGGNGTGKSSFIKLLLGELKPDSGRFVIGETVRFGYYSQQGMEFDNKMKVIDVVTRYAETIDIGNGKRLTAMQFLNHFLFPPSRQQDYVYKLSGGERRRLYLCTVLMQNPNFLVLDEPTNDLDILTLQILEEYLKDFSGCVIIISHDRYFMDKVVDHLLVFEGDGEIDQFPGNYSQFFLYQKEKEKTQKEEAKKTSVAQTETKKDNTRTHQRKMTFKEKQEFQQLEKEIKSLEEERHTLLEKMNNGTLPYEEIAPLSERFANVKELLEEKEMRWLELDEIN